jgi:cell wall-associated NlpC family hydrolase
MRKLLPIVFIPLFIITACSGPVKRTQTGPPSRPLPGEDAERLLAGAFQHIGEPYRYGGFSSRGWDCSGFVHGMYKRYLGISVPRSTKKLYLATYDVEPRKSRPGDLVFFRFSSAKPSHVGIYMGKAKFIHSSTSAGVIVSSLREDYYRNHFYGYRRIRHEFLAAGR